MSGKRPSLNVVPEPAAPTRDPPAPAHLRPATRAWWGEVVAMVELEPHHLELLRLCCEALDRAAEAREELEREGTYVRNRHGEWRAHPAAGVERDSRIAAARLIRELDLDHDDEPAAPRPPAIRSNRRGRR